MKSYRTIFGFNIKGTVIGREDISEEDKYNASLVIFSELQRAGELNGLTCPNDVFMAARALTLTPLEGNIYMVTAFQQHLGYASRIILV